VGYLADRFARLGIEDELLELGAQAGDAVAIGTGDNAVVFDFAPQIEVGAEILASRGDDQRLHEPRPAARRRRELDAAYHARKEAERLTQLAAGGLAGDESSYDESEWAASKESALGE
jgi:GTP-binding protein